MFDGQKGVRGFSICKNAIWVASPIGSSSETKSILHIFFSIRSSQSSTLDCECGVMDNTLQEEKERIMLFMASSIRSLQWYEAKQATYCILVINHQYYLTCTFFLSRYPCSSMVL